MARCISGMLLKHVALGCRSEENSDRFYGKLLGLKKVRSRTVQPSISKQIFGLDKELKIIEYADESIHFEVFAGVRENSESHRVEHVCLEVTAIEAFLSKCRDMGIATIQVPRGDALLTFIRDDDGNLFEIKEAI
jgi:catechol 2,3-dioxygenase-like lactoylglutathione lyase family enzyme